MLNTISKPRGFGSANSFAWQQQNPRAFDIDIADAFLTVRMDGAHAAERRGCRCLLPPVACSHFFFLVVAWLWRLHGLDTTRSNADRCHHHLLGG
jgi:hypothetical protein